MSDLAPALKENGFRAVDSDLPGGWATDGEHTVCVNSERSSGGLAHTVYVYDDPASLLSIETSLLAREHDSAHGLAVRRALDRAEATEADQ